MEAVTFFCLVADISSKENAKRAVTLIAQSITVLGRVQGDVRSAQNTLIFTLSLASTPVVNFSAAESRIRDADIAFEASNLTKASIRQQAGIAALRKPTQRHNPCWRCCEHNSRQQLLQLNFTLHQPGRPGR